MGDKIVIVEDDESIRRVLEVTLTSHGYEAVPFDNAPDALRYMDGDVPALAVFDIMMPGMDGLEAVARMRRDERLRELPVIFLTAKDSEIDKIVGLDVGADDYMTKPFSVLELCARIRARLRRTVGEPDNAAPLFECGGLTVNINTREVTLDGALLPLTLKEFELLRLLTENRERVLTRSELLARVWGEDYYGESRTLDIHIGTLRQKLGDAADNSRFIRTVRGVGYRFVGGTA